MKLKAVTIMGLRLFSLAVGAAILTLATLPARAEVVTFANYVNDANPTYLTVLPYASLEKTTQPSTNNLNFFVGLTQGIITVGGTIGSDGRVTGGDPSAMFYMYCVDFAGEIRVPTSYLVNVQSIAGPGPISDQFLGEDLPTLQLQAILGGDFGTLPSLNAQADSDIQEDIWNLSVHLPPPFTPTQGMMDDLTAAQNATGVDFSNAYLLDTTGSSGQQAFMPVDAGMTHSNPLPEPGTLFLLGAGLLAVGFTRRSR